VLKTTPAAAAAHIKTPTGSPDVVGKKVQPLSSSTDVNNVLLRQLAASDWLSITIGAAVSLSAISLLTLAIGQVYRNCCSNSRRRLAPNTAYRRGGIYHRLATKPPTDADSFCRGWRKAIAWMPTPASANGGSSGQPERTTDQKCDIHLQEQDSSRKLLPATDQATSGSP
jgi:hypothetical protein